MSTFRVYKWSDFIKMPSKRTLNVCKLAALSSDAPACQANIKQDTVHSDSHSDSMIRVNSDSETSSINMQATEKMIFAFHRSYFPYISYVFFFLRNSKIGYHLNKVLTIYGTNDTKILTAWLCNRKIIVYIKVYLSSLF